MKNWVIEYDRRGNEGRGIWRIRTKERLGGPGIYRLAIAETHLQEVATLIRSSPELLECLREACEIYLSQNGSKPPESWLLAIAKAEGRAK